MTFIQLINLATPVILVTFSSSCVDQLMTLTIQCWRDVTVTGIDEIDDR